MRTILKMQMLSIILLMGCTPTETEENWIGHYQLPEVDEKFPIYFQLILTGTDISGTALDGNLEVAAITGSVADGIYELNLHPLKHGRDTSQDIIYRAQRNKSSLLGKWEHSVGVKGPWTATVTHLTKSEAKQLLLAPCSKRNDKKERICVLSPPNRSFKPVAAFLRTFASKVVWLRHASALRQMPLNSVLAARKIFHCHR